MKDKEIILSRSQKDSELPAALEKEEIKYRFAPLNFADILVDGRIGIVRRNVVDFVEDMKSKMLYRNLIAFKRQYPEPLYLFEIDQMKVFEASRITIRNAVTFITVLNRVPIIRATSVDDSAKYLNVILRQTDFSAPIHNGKAIDNVELNDNGSYKFQTLTALPEISDEIAEELITEFGSLKNIFTATSEQLELIKGIGPKKSLRIIEAIKSSAN